MSEIIQKHIKTKTIITLFVVKDYVCRFRSEAFVISTLCYMVMNDNCIATFNKQEKENKKCMSKIITSSSKKWHKLKNALAEKWICQHFFSESTS